MCWLSTINIEEVVTLCGIMYVVCMWQKFGWKGRKRAADMKYNKRGQEAWWFSTTPPTQSTQYLHTIYTLHYTHTASCNMDTQHTGELTNFWIQQYSNTHSDDILIALLLESSAPAQRLSWPGAVAQIMAANFGIVLRTDPVHCKYPALVDVDTLPVLCTCRYKANILHS